MSIFQALSRAAVLKVGVGIGTITVFTERPGTRFACQGTAVEIPSSYESRGLGR